ncbi:hypothetical protein C8R45DRAFT_1158334 [Mycena sanguinolenta]|nr:hypothetical protein C8R45DRAFT_1158334 [Mycena sanguinolenta]
MRNLTSEALPSLLLALVAAIPNHALRYTALVSLFAVTIFCTFRLSPLSAQMHKLTTSINQTEEYIRREMVHYPRCRGSLTLQMLSLLDWKGYRLRSSEIQECHKDIKDIHTTVELILEAEHQRRLADDILETQFLLTAA